MTDDPNPCQASGRPCSALDSAERPRFTPTMPCGNDLFELLDNPFHSAALTAFVEQSQHQQSWPCPQATKQRAYRHYEADLAAKNRNLSPHPGTTAATDRNAHAAPSSNNGDPKP